MNRVSFTVRRMILPYLLSFPSLVAEKELAPLPLPPPHMKGGRPLMQVLNERRTSRSYDPHPLPSSVLSNLLWAASGVNRAEQGKRTAPSARNRQEIEIFISRADGLYLYDAKSHGLCPVLEKDIRILTGRSRFVSEAPVNLVFVADLALFDHKKESDKVLYSAADTGFVSQNVYLFCASEGLVTCVRGDIDRASLAKVMKLRPEQQIILAQSVGYPAGVGQSGYA